PYFLFASTLKLQEAGVGSDTPPTTALTRILCRPGFSDGAVNGERQALNGLLSTLHWKLAPATLALNLIVGVRSWVFAGGFGAILVSGGLCSSSTGGGGGGLCSSSTGGTTTLDVVNVWSVPGTVPATLWATSW